MSMTQRCWCGNEDLSEYSSEYYLCNQCGTLVSVVGLDNEQIKVKDDESDFYGMQYWLSHQTENYGLPDIFQRVRQDLPERCLYWLKVLLKYKLPPATVLELGSAHGGFVAMMNWAGFKATGLEMSPWVVEFASKTFDVPMLVGPIENQAVEKGSLDAIALFDVLEHLPDPLSTMQYCASLLKEDGIFMVQMPNYEEGKAYAQLVEQQDIFLEQMKGVEHLHLLSHRAAKELFSRIGFHSLTFEQQLFPYDMFFIASRQPIVTYPDNKITEALTHNVTGRLVQALIDQTGGSHGPYAQLEAAYQEAERDRAERLKVIERQGEEIGRISAENNQNLILLQQTRGQLQHLKSQFLRNQEQLEQYQKLASSPQSAKELLERLRTKIQNAEAELGDARNEIEAMKTSKFWKLRSLWFKVKKAVGLPATE